MKIATLSFLFLALIGNTIDMVHAKLGEENLKEDHKMRKMKETLYKSKEKLELHNAGKSILSEKVSDHLIGDG